jgi:hypothetical protein
MAGGMALGADERDPEDEGCERADPDFRRPRPLPGPFYARGVSHGSGSVRAGD